MAAENVLRLAWYADRDGRRGRRDALVTLAIVLGHAENAPWVERALRWLVAERPDHLFAVYPTLELAFADKRTAEALDTIRYAYPTPRIRSLLLRAATNRGRFSGRKESLAIILEDLFRPHRSEVRASDARGLRVRSKASRPKAADLPFAAPDNASPAATSGRSREDGERELVTFYMTLLLAMAVLLESVTRSRERENKAA